jgi:hypothetical protein
MFHFTKSLITKNNCYFTKSLIARNISIQNVTAKQIECKNCQYFKKENNHCLHPSLTIQHNKINLVKSFDCFDMRNDFSKCGIEGKFYKNIDFDLELGVCIVTIFIYPCMLISMFIN